jgi:hypothetical protein
MGSSSRFSFRPVSSSSSFQQSFMPVVTQTRFMSLSPWQMNPTPNLWASFIPQMTQHQTNFLPLDAQGLMQARVAAQFRLSANGMRIF